MEFSDMTATVVRVVRTNPGRRDKVRVRVRQRILARRLRELIPRVWFFIDPPKIRDPLRRALTQTMIRARVSRQTFHTYPLFG